MEQVLLRADEGNFRRCSRRSLYSNELCLHSSYKWQAQLVLNMISIH